MFFKSESINELTEYLKLFGFRKRIQWFESERCSINYSHSKFNMNIVINVDSIDFCILYLNSDEHFIIRKTNYSEFKEHYDNDRFFQLSTVADISPLLSFFDININYDEMYSIADGIGHRYEK